MNSWYLLALSSTLLNGARAFLTKRSAQGATPTMAARIIPSGVMVACGSLVVWQTVSSVGLGMRALLVSASLQGALFYIAALSRWEALRLRTPAHVLFPIVQASTPVLVVISAVLFDEWAALLAPQRLSGVSVALLSSFVLVDWKRLDWSSSRGVAFAVISMLASTGATLAAKYAFDADAQGSIFVFIVVSNAVGLALGVAHSLVVDGFGSHELRARQWLESTVVGILNFAALAAFLRAIKLGDLVVVASIGSLSAIVPIVLSVAWDGEVLRGRQDAAVALSILALLLLA